MLHMPSGFDNLNRLGVLENLDRSGWPNNPDRPDGPNYLDGLGKPLA